MKIVYERLSLLVAAIIIGIYCFATSCMADTDEEKLIGNWILYKVTLGQSGIVRTAEELDINKQLQLFDDKRLYTLTDGHIQASGMFEVFMPTEKEAPLNLPQLIVKNMFSYYYELKKENVLLLYESAHPENISEYRRIDNEGHCAIGNVGVE